MNLLTYDQWELLGEDVGCVWDAIPAHRREGMVEKDLRCAGRVWRDGEGGGVHSFVVGGKNQTTWTVLWNGGVIAHTAEPVRRMLWQTRQDFISQRNLEAIAQRNASDAAASEG